jgi:hypothetical protein
MQLITNEPRAYTGSTTGARHILDIDWALREIPRMPAAAECRFVKVMPVESAAR